MTADFPLHWFEAEIADEEGRLDRPLPSRGLPIPAEIRVREGRLEWRDHPLGARPPRVPPGAALLTSFVRLAKAPDARIAEYARRWGVLGLCNHGRPFIHGSTICKLQTLEDVDGLTPDDYRELMTELEPTERMGVERTLKEVEQEQQDGWYWEPTAHWRELALEARETIDLAANAHLNRVVRPQFLMLRFPHLFRKGTIEEQRVAVEWIVECWLGWGMVQPFFEWRRRVASVTLGGVGLFAALAMQLLFAVTRTKGFEICSECGDVYWLTRRRATSRYRYCPKCGLRAAQRAASQAYRERVAEARQLHSEGLSPTGIARRIGGDPRTVREWLEVQPTKRPQRKQ